MNVQPSQAPRPIVLVVEDEPIVRLVARDTLEESGFEVIEAHTAEEAVATLDGRCDIAAIFTDVHTPGCVDGLELARMAPERWPGVKIAVTSGRARPETCDLPPNALFVPKPYNPGWLAKAIQALVSGGRAS